MKVWKFMVIKWSFWYFMTKVEEAGLGYWTAGLAYEWNILISLILSLLVNMKSFPIELSSDTFKSVPVNVRMLVATRLYFTVIQNETRSALLLNSSNCRNYILYFSAEEGDVSTLGTIIRDKSNHESFWMKMEVDVKYFILWWAL